MAKQHHAHKMHEELAVLRKHFPNKRNNELHRMRKQINEQYGSVEEWERMSDNNNGEKAKESQKDKIRPEKIPVEGPAIEAVNSAHMDNVNTYALAGQLVHRAHGRERAHAFIDAYCELAGESQAVEDVDREET